MDLVYEQVHSQHVGNFYTLILSVRMETMGRPGTTHPSPVSTMFFRTSKAVNKNVLGAAVESRVCVGLA